LCYFTNDDDDDVNKRFHSHFVSLWHSVAYNPRTVTVAATAAASTSLSH